MAALQRNGQRFLRENTNMMRPAKNIPACRERERERDRERVSPLTVRNVTAVGIATTAVTRLTVKREQFMALKYNKNETHFN